VYRDFKSKDALLDAGIDRPLDRRHAMRDIRATIGKNPQSWRCMCKTSQP
jgi:hypothetical protein